MHEVMRVGTLVVRPIDPANVEVGMYLLDINPAALADPENEPVTVLHCHPGQPMVTVRLDSGSTGTFGRADWGLILGEAPDLSGLVSVRDKVRAMHRL